ncbi:hypothetical protein R1sor_019965 [Riccia sorocarpa]|uniref:Uncharacterized protein n=1 Tax=Riccia sorocarpa TaxID=122646 RepID=A0ABD3IE40_9MARC
MTERIYCRCAVCKGVVLQTRWRTILHVDKYGLYEPPVGQASTSTPSPLFDISLEAIVQQALRPAMDQLAERLYTIRPTTPVVSHDVVPMTGRVTRLHSSDLRPPWVSVGDTIQIPSRHGPLSITRKAATTYRSCNCMYWGVHANISIREVVTVWGRRWIVKESTIPNTGLGLFAVDGVVVEPNTHYDNYPQLFRYVGAVYKHKEYKLMLQHMPSLIDYILDTSQKVPGGAQKRRYIDGDPVRTGNIAGYIQSSLGTNIGSNAEWHYVDGGHMWFHRRWNKGFHIMTVASRTIEPGEEGFDPPEVEAFSRRARRRIQAIQAASIGDQAEIEDEVEDEDEDEHLDDAGIYEEAYIQEEELQDQAVLADFFNMRSEATLDTPGENCSQLDEYASSGSTQLSFTQEQLAGFIATYVPLATIRTSASASVSVTPATMPVPPIIVAIPSATMLVPPVTVSVPPVTMPIPPTTMPVSSATMPVPSAHPITSPVHPSRAHVRPVTVPISPTIPVLARQLIPRASSASQSHGRDRRRSCEPEVASRSGRRSRNHQDGPSVTPIIVVSGIARPKL